MISHLCNSLSTLNVPLGTLNGPGCLDKTFSSIEIIIAHKCLEHKLFK